MNSWKAGLTLGTMALAAVACGSSTKTPSATPAPPTTAAPTTAAPTNTSSAVFPSEAGTTRYKDPVAAATAFATDYAGFVAPLVGAFQQGDSRSGEVQVRPSAGGPVTTVSVRQLGTNDTWWVLGASTAAIKLTEPVWSAPISSPVTLKGTSSAFEGTVQTQVREDGTSKPLGAGFVTGGSTGMGPFNGTLAFTKPTTKYGAVILYTTSQEGAPVGHTREATVLRVRFGS